MIDTHTHGQTHRHRQWLYTKAKTGLGFTQDTWKLKLRYHYQNFVSVHVHGNDIDIFVLGNWTESPGDFRAFIKPFPGMIMVIIDCCVSIISSIWLNNFNGRFVNDICSCRNEKSFSWGARKSEIILLVFKYQFQIHANIFCITSKAHRGTHVILSPISVEIP